MLTYFLLRGASLLLSELEKESRKKSEGKVDLESLNKRIEKHLSRDLENLDK